MRVVDLIRLASEYLKTGIIIGIFMILCIFAGYFLVYRKLLKGQRVIGWKVFLWWGILLCYLSVVSGATLLSRGGFWTDGKIQPLFYSYRDAWINFSDAAWRNIILNFCMFIPFGIWIPLGIKRFRKFWKTYLAGFAFALLIECIQLLFRRGIFESGEYQFETAMSETEDSIVNGRFVCSYYGERGIGQVSDFLITCTPYKAYPAISEQEAYEKIVKGEFQFVGGEPLEIQVESCSLVYCIDSKGYYQPNYQFECVINGAESVIMIPAINM